MKVEVITPFTMPNIAPFRKGEKFDLSDAEAQPLITGKLVRPVGNPEFATSKVQKAK